MTHFTTEQREELLDGAPYRDYYPGEELPIGDPACWRCGATERVRGTTLCPECLPATLTAHAGESAYAAARAAWQNTASDCERIAADAEHEGDYNRARRFRAQSAAALAAWAGYREAGR